MSTVIEIASIRPPKEGKKVATIVDADGASFEIWPEKLAKLEVGQRYAVEVETREWQGRPIRKITKAQPFTNRTHVSDLKPAAPATGVSKNSAAMAEYSTAEQAFVASIVTAFIAAGKVDLDRGDLEQAVTLARALWRTTMA